MKAFTFLLTVSLAAAAAASDLAKLFTDQGKTYVRTDNVAAFVPGTELAAFSDEAGARPAGKAIVMEVTGQLIRLSLDEDALNAKARYVRVARAAASTAAPPPPPPPPTPPPAAPVAPAVPGVGRLPPLRASLSRGNGTIVVRNDSEGELTGCELKFPDRRFARAGTLPPRSAVSVGYDAIKDAPDVGNDWLEIRCVEGSGEFRYGQPGQPPLAGHVEGGRSGGVFIYNDGNFDWTGCDLIKPNGNHFFQGGLKAHASDSIRGGLFKAQAGAEVITLTCAQGRLSQPVP